MSKVLKRDIEFLFEVGTLGNLKRNWQQFLGMGGASVLEHTMRVVFIALIIARAEKCDAEEKIIKMALAHDLSETRTNDTNYVQAVYTTKDEARATRDLFFGTSLRDFDRTIVREYEARKTLAAKIVKDADNLDVDFELKEFAHRGSAFPRKGQRLRRIVRGRLYTKTAKRLWDELQKADPASWHLKANKWVKMKNSGK